MGWVWLLWLVSTVRTHFKSRKEAAQLGWGGPVAIDGGTVGTNVGSSPVRMPIIDSMGHSEREQ